MKGEFDESSAVTGARLAVSCFSFLLATWEKYVAPRMWVNSCHVNGEESRCRSRTQPPHKTGDRTHGLSTHQRTDAEKLMSGYFSETRCFGVLFCFFLHLRYGFMLSLLDGACC